MKTKESFHPSKPAEMAELLIEALEEAIEGLSLPKAIGLLARRFEGSISFSTSFGQEDQVISDIIFRHGHPVRVFTLDTGRMFQETYDVMDRTRSKYGQNIEVFYPDATAIQKLVTAKGPNSFYESVENRKECCYIRKVEPLRRALAGQNIWITGLRAAQSANRQSLKRFVYDPGFDLVKYNPLIDWTLEEVEKHLSRFKVPQNTLHKQGFASIGCAPCTRAIAPGEDIRAGRWWWEASSKECGLHAVGKHNNQFKNQS